MSSDTQHESTTKALSSGKTSISCYANNKGCNVAISVPVASKSYDNGSSWTASVGAGYAGSYSGNGSYGVSAGISYRF